MALVRCANCRKPHDVDLGTLVRLVQMFQVGDMQTVTGIGVESMCLYTAGSEKKRGRPRKLRP